MIDKETAIVSIAEERMRQFKEENFSLEHDDTLVHGQLFKAAQLYYRWATGKDLPQKAGGVPTEWPFDDATWKPKTKLRDLIRSGALCEAEKERLFRKNPPNVVFATMQVNVLLHFVADTICALDFPAMAIERPRTVPDRLAALGKVYQERTDIYGDNYKHFGITLAGMFPAGVTLNGAEQFNRFALLLNIAHKAAHYAHAMADGGHPGSLDDITVYAQMLQEYDDDLSEGQKKLTK